MNVARSNLPPTEKRIPLNQEGAIGYLVQQALSVYKYDAHGTVGLAPQEIVRIAGIDPFQAAEPVADDELRRPRCVPTPGLY